MNLYQPCPCHPEQKLKFCCGKEVVAQLGKSVEMMEGGQRLKAIQSLDRAISQFGYKDCLASMRFVTALDAADLEMAQQVSQGYAQEHGENCLALAMHAYLRLENSDVDGAVDSIQSALETEEKPPTLLEDAMVSTAYLLSRQRSGLSAREHLSLYVEISGDRRELGVRQLRALRETPRIPLVLKNDWPLPAIPEGKSWSIAAAQAVHWAGRGWWRKALMVLAPLAKENPNEAVLWKNVAILHGHLNQLDKAAAAWQHYAAECHGVHPDHAVEAELTGLLLSDFPDGERYDEVEWTWEISDLPGFLQQAATDPNLRELADISKLDYSRIEESPKAVFFVELYEETSDQIADGSSESSSSLNFELALLVHAKRTDRAARIVFSGLALPGLNLRLQKVFQPYAQLDFESRQELVIGQELGWVADFHCGITAGMRLHNADDDSDRIQSAWGQDFVRRLPKYRTALLGGQTFAQAAEDPKWQRRVAALLLFLENNHSFVFDTKECFARARAALNLPPLETINPKTVRLEELSLTQFARLDFSLMPVPLLSWALDVAMKVGNMPALWALIADIERRLAVDEQEVQRQLPVASIYLLAALLVRSKSQARKFLDLGYRHLPSEPQPRAQWLLRALELAGTRRLEGALQQYYAELLFLANRDQWVHKEVVKLNAAMGLAPPPKLEPGAATSAAATAASVAAGDNPPPAEFAAHRNPDGGPVTVGQAAETPAKPASRLWLPGME